MLNFIEEPITVYTLSTKEKHHHQSKITQQIISIITDLTKKNNVYHKIYYVDKQSPELIFLKPKEDLDNGLINMMYTGITKTPPYNIKFNNEIPIDDFYARDPDKFHPIYTGKFYRPFINYNKKDISHLYDLLKIKDNIFPLTRSCSMPNHPDGHCKKCWWCEERFWAFGYFE